MFLKFGFLSGFVRFLLLVGQLAASMAMIGIAIGYPRFECGALLASRLLCNLPISAMIAGSVGALLGLWGLVDTLRENIEDGSSPFCFGAVNSLGSLFGWVLLTLAAIVISEDPEELASEITFPALLLAMGVLLGLLALLTAFDSFTAAFLSGLLPEVLSKGAGLMLTSLSCLLAAMQLSLSVLALFVGQFVRFQDWIPFVFGLATGFLSLLAAVFVLLGVLRRHSHNYAAGGTAVTCCMWLINVVAMSLAVYAGEQTTNSFVSSTSYLSISLLFVSAASIPLWTWLATDSAISFIDPQADRRSGYTSINTHQRY